ncbi:uncharacterized protein K452DRAFT_224976 [Aplosporella prunicola CBS 121167]|uniref:C4-dicarboxylate transporter/malic acid transport protein n=1 Tax=Aplosporella prunicola CBS 121167 TaxID=1176127 RepID=A0A6A6BGV6_9PEZI|nr:uncharacterized protein K452DRAFT_224976 [Aplosporella prunicola CBS 121167]KAF2143206.1 hypothetical protein K452DRAFT_224976 [Aplosporella prunicola CBS 121167]
MSGTATPVNGAQVPETPLPTDIEKKRPASDNNTAESGRLGNGRVGFRDRIQHFTWAWYTTTMSTGGLALLLGKTPHRFNGLDVIGRIVYIFDLVLFVLFAIAMVTRFVTCPRAFKASLTDWHESVFFAPFWLSCATIIGNMKGYGLPHAGPWLVDCIRVLFWIYCACTTITAIALHFSLINISAPKGVYNAKSMNPTWLFPLFPIMLTGTISSIVADTQTPAHRLPMIVAGITCQGVGWMYSFAITTIYLFRVMHAGMIPYSARPGMFMMVGAPSFTALALIGNSKALPTDYGYFAEHPIAAEVLQIMAVWIAIFLWCLAFWFFSIAVVANIQAARTGEMRFALGWWGFVFPNVGFTVATILIGQAFKSEGILWVGSIMTIFIVIAWLSVGFGHVRALYRGDICYPGKDEDRFQPHVMEKVAQE